MFSTPNLAKLHQTYLVLPRVATEVWNLKADPPCGGSHWVCLVYQSDNSHPSFPNLPELGSRHQASFEACARRYSEYAVKNKRAFFMQVLSLITGRKE